MVAGPEPDATCSGGTKLLGVNRISTKDSSTGAGAHDSAGSMKPPELVTATQAELDQILALTKLTLPARPTPL